MPSALCQSRLYHSVPHHSGTIHVPFPYQLSDTVCFLAMDWTLYFWWMFENNYGSNRIVIDWESRLGVLGTRSCGRRNRWEMQGEPKYRGWGGIVPERNGWSRVTKGLTDCNKFSSWKFAMSSAFTYIYIYITLRIQHMFIFTPTKGPLPKIILEDFLDSCPNTIAIAILDGQGPKRPHQLCNNVWHRLVNTGKTLHFMYMTYHQAVTPHYWYPMGTAMCSSEGSPVLCWLVPVAPSTPVVDGTCKANWERNRSEGYARIILERVLSYLKSHANTPRRLDSQFWKPMFLHYITTYYIYIQFT